MKRVRVTVELDNTFIALLRAQLTLKGKLGEKGDDANMTAMDVLGRLVLGEAMGAKEIQIHAATPPEWRPNIDIINVERRVYEDGKLIAGPVLEVKR